MSIDALPYHDSQLTEEQRSAVDALIAREVPQHRPPHPSLPQISEWRPRSDLIRQELDRVASGTKLNALDVSRYEDIEPPSTEDLSLWRAAMDRNIVAAAAMNSREENLELLKQYGTNAWSMHVFQLEQSLKLIEEELLQTRRETEQINIARKRSQLQAGQELTRLDEKWRSLVSGNIEVNVACALLEQELAQKS